MKYIQALLSFVLFGWLGFAVATNNLPFGGGTFRNALDSIVFRFGPEKTGAFLLAFGVLLALYFLIRDRTSW